MFTHEEEKKARNFTHAWLGVVSILLRGSSS